MSFIVLAVVVVAMVGSLYLGRVHRRQLREQARLKAIEAQMAGLRAALRISAAEQATRQRMHQLHEHNVFTNSTLHEEPELWR